MKEEVMEDLKHPQENNKDPFQTSSMDHTAAARASDYIWNKILFYILDCTWKNGWPGPPNAFSGGQQSDFKGLLGDILSLMALKDA